MSWLVRTFTTDTGRKPVDEWVAGLDQEAQAAVNAVVNLLKEYGVELGGEHVDFLGDGVWELRARDRNGIYRVLYFHWKGRTFGFLHGFTKKTQKIPPQELAIAKHRRAVWLSRQTGKGL